MLSRARQKELAALASRHQRRKRREVLLEGPVLIRTVLGLPDPAWRVHYMVVAESARDDAAVADVADQASECGIDVEVVADADLKEWADTRTPQGVLGVASRREDVTLASAIMEATTAGSAGLSPIRLLVLDAVQDPGNVGTLIRSAAAFGVGAVALCVGSAEFSHPRVLRASMGAAFHLPVANRVNRVELGAALADAGLPLWIADAGGDSMRTVDWSAPVALALGAEVAGPSDALRAASTLAGRVSVPQQPVPQSLNVAMAGSILLAHAYRG